MPDAEVLLSRYRAAQWEPAPVVALRDLVSVPSEDDLASYRAVTGQAPLPPAGLKEVVRTFAERIGYQYYNTKILLRQDPILRLGLGSHRDEREWRGMVGSEFAISTAIDNLLDTTLGYGWEVQKKGKKSGPAQKLEEFARAAVARIPRFQSALRLACYGKFFGWTALQMIWEPEAFRFGGKTFRGVTRIAEQHGEHFGWTVPESGQDSRLAFLGDGFQPPEVYEADAQRAAWCAIQCGSLRDPYGHAKCSDLWFLWFALRKFTEFYEIGARNALSGMPVLQRKPGATGPQIPGVTGKEQVLTLEKMGQELQAMMKFMRETGALAVGQDYEFKIMADPAKAEGWERAIAVLREAFAIAIEGQTLTSTVSKSGGSRALGDVQKDTKVEKCRALAEEVTPQVSEQIIHRLIRLNFPGEIDPDDLPDLVFSVQTAIDPERVKAFVDLGGEVDGETVARAWNVPMADPKDIAAAQEVGSPGKPTLRRQQVGSLLPGIGEHPPKGEIGGPGPGPVPIKTPGSPTAPQEAAAAPPPRPVSARTGARALPAALTALADHVDASATSLEAEQAGRVSSSWRAYIQAMADAAAEAGGDGSLPFPSALP